MNLVLNSKKLIKYHLFLIGLISGSWGFAGPETKIVVSDAAFEVSQGLELNFDIPDHLTDPLDRKFYALIREKNTDYDFHRFFEKELFKFEFTPNNRARFDSLLASYIARFPMILKEHLEKTLKEFDHNVEQVDGGQIITIPRGLEFWIRMVTHPNPEKRVAGLIFLNRPFGKDWTGLPGHLVEMIEDAHQPKTQILRTDFFVEKELLALIEYAQKNGFYTPRHGKYLLVGKGQSLDLLRELFLEAKGLQDPDLQQKFVRILDFLSAQGVTIEMDEHQGAAAYFALGQKRIAFVMPSRIDLDTLTHESTHGRFDEFLDAFGKWTRKKNYAVPYEIDGPFFALFSNLGGYMNLLNELNSYRVGSSFSKKMSDSEILKILEESYGRQAGYKTAYSFASQWPASQVENKSVPALILNATRNLNKMSNDQVLEYGKKSLATQNEIEQHNFLRLVVARFKSENVPSEFLEVVTAIHRESLHSNVQDIAKRVLARRVPSAKSIVEETARATEAAPNPRNFETLWKEFLHKPTYEINEELVENHFQQFHSEHVRTLITLAFDDDPDSEHRTLAFKLLEGLFEKLGFEKIYEASEYSGMTALQQSMNRTNNRPLDADLPKARPSNPSHWLFDPKTDELLAQRMFDGRVGTSRLDLINFIAGHTYPHELPRLRRRIVEVISQDGKSLDVNDFWVARMFLVPAKTILYQTHIVWGEFVAGAVLNDLSPQPTALEFVAEYYRLAVSKTLPLSSFRVASNAGFDETLRREFKASLRKATSRQKHLLKKGTQTLWKLLGHENPTIRRAARYAIATHPGFLLEVETSIIEALKTPDSRYRSEAVSLFSYVKPGFFLKIERALKDQKFEFTPKEKLILGLRRSIENQGDSCSDYLFHVVKKGAPQ